ncbi:hypothetical protein B0H34DRAFT_677029 [Crassisporium funariophilum]|nr:hypothetical protein B0H34DRAFT_677029 [Crassisporium funariophilum]
MAPLAVHIKHAGKTYALPLDPDLPPRVFKDAVYAATGVPPDRMKVMVKGGVLKDDTPWKKVGPKDGQTFMVIGAAGDLPKAPTGPIVFLEDMDDSALAEALAIPVGFNNLGNTCYMNATIQALRAVPELQVALSTPSLQSDTPLPGALRDLYRNMAKTTDSISPVGFLQVLRQVNPQFAEQAPSPSPLSPRGMAYAQQDAEECFAAVVNTLRNVPGLDKEGGSVGTGAQAEVAMGGEGGMGGAGGRGRGRGKFVEQFMMGEMRRVLTCDEAPEEPPTVQTEQVLKIECNININTNFMVAGIMSSLDTQLEKTSPTLGRQALYTQKSRLTRLPGYLTVHMVRFAWREDIGRKAKIMRRVKFPLEFDALELATDELREKLLPASRKLKEIEKGRGERRKVRKRTKAAASAPAGSSTSASATTTTAATAALGGDVEMTDVSQAGGEGAGAEGEGKKVEGGELEDERVYREREARELRALVHEDVGSDVGCSVTGLYDLVAIVTHKGAAADAGHYIGFVKKSVFHAQNRGPPPLLSLSPSSPTSPSLSASASASAGTLDPSIPLPSLLAAGIAGAPLPTSIPTSTSSIAAGVPPQQYQHPTPDPDDLEDDDDWYKFDDEKVSLFPAEKIGTLEGGGEDSVAYVLIYRSKGV